MYGYPLNDIRKTLDDPIAFIEKFLKIWGPEGLADCKLYNFQKVALRKYNRNKKTVGLWSRQMGGSVISMAYLLWYAIRYPNSCIGIISPKLSYGNHLSNLIKQFYDYIPAWIKPKIVISNQSKISFDNGSKILFMSAQNSIYAMRGISFNVMYIEQAGFMRHFYELLQLSVHVITNGKLIISSSYNETAVTFNDYYAKCNRLEKFKVKWSKLKSRDNKFKETMIKMIGEDAFNRDFELK